jgi:hypothetical protein
MYEEPMHNERELPSFYLRQIDLPEVLTWKVGEQYYLLMKVEMTGLEKYEDEDKKIKKMEGGFKVKSVRAIDGKPVDLKAVEKEDFERKVASIKSGEY